MSAGPAPALRLEEERQFLLASLRDLEAERAAGDIAPDDYRRLRDAYTVRAAAVIRALDGRPPGDPAPAGGSPAGAADSDCATDAPGEADTTLVAGPDRPDRQRGRAGTTTVARGPAAGAGRGGRLRPALVAAAVVAAAGLAGWAVAATSGERSATGEATGSLPESSVDRITRAQALVAEGEIMAALRIYDSLLDDDPGNPVALAQRGWLISRVDPSLVDDGLASIDRAIAEDPRYPEAHFFRGMILWRSKGDAAAGAAEFQKALDAGAPPSLVPLLEQVRDEAAAAAAPAGP